MASRASKIKFMIVFTAIVSIMMLNASSQETSLPEPTRAELTVDVESQIWPIFRSRCLRCHGPNDSEGKGAAGGFRIDTMDGILEGGHTGNAVLGESGELLQRLSSTDANYRMPKDEPPLSNSQLELIRNWVRAGTPWPENGVITFPESKQRNEQPPGLMRNQSFGHRFFNTLDDIHKKIRVIMIPMTAFHLGMLLLERRKRKLHALQPQATTPPPKLNWLDRLAFSATGAHYLSLYLIIVLAGFSLYHVRRVEEFEKKLNYQRQNTSGHIFASARINDAITDRSLQPYRPQHPSRLGGVYYRGNDERNNKLFNGGYYRTATMTLSLRDNNNQLIQWGDKLDANQCFIRLEIKNHPSRLPSSSMSEYSKDAICRWRHPAPR